MILALFVIAAATDFDDAQLAAYLRDAQATKTNAVIVMRDGKTIVEQYWDSKPEQAIKVRSITKVLTALAIAALVEEGKIASLDEPLARWIPEWKKDARKAITLRHVLSHTTGLEPRFGDAELTSEPDAFRFVRSMQLADAPGTAYVYSNQALELASLVVQAETGGTLAAFVQKRIFTPLGIGDVTWSSDKAGHTHGYAGLELTARDVAKLGWMLCDGGRYGGKQIVAEKWLDEAARPSSPVSQVYGLGLELFPEMGYERGRLSWSPLVEARLAAAGFLGAKKLEALRGRWFDDLDALTGEVAALLDERERAQLAGLRRLLADVRPTSDVVAYGHSGSFGQLLMCVKEPDTPPTVFVRLLRESGGGPFSATDRARMTLHPARRCPAFYDANVGDGQCVAKGTKDRLILFLHGMYNPHGPPSVFEDERRFVEAAKARGYWVYAPRGGPLAWNPDWIGWPSSLGQIPEAGKFAVELGKWNPKVSALMRSTATRRPFLLGFSSGAHFSSMLIAGTKLDFGAWAALHGGGAAFDFDAKRALPTLVVTARADSGERPNTYALHAKLARVGWAHRFIDEPGVHALQATDVAAALDLFDASGGH